MCPECDGTGNVTQMAGAMKFSLTCPRCDGKGRLRNVCPKCHGDGRISKAEAAKGPMAARFDEMDANKDGYLDKADREQRMKQHRAEWFAKADADKDGKLSRAEFDAAKPVHQMHGGPIDAPPPKP